MNKAGVLASTVAAAGLFGCALDQPSESSTAGMSFEELKARAGREPGTGAYVLDWDMVIHGDDALFDYWSRSQQGALTIYSVGGTQIKWDATQKKNLTYCIGGGFGATNKQLIKDAMKAATEGGWEKFADVNFTHVELQDANCNAQNANVMFDVNLAPTGAGYLARAFFPNDARGNRNVLVAVESFNPQQTGGITLTNILIHELGHALGFRHEHIRAPGAPCPEDNQYAAVTPYDQVSTMHYPQCGSPNNTLALSNLDRSGVAMVYGAPIVNMPPMTNITSPANGATVGPTFRVSSAIVDTDLVKAELLIDGTVYQTLTTGPFDFQVTDLALGEHQLQIKGTDGGGLTSTTSITVTVTKGGGSGTGSGNGTGNGNGTGGGDGAETDVVGGCSTGGGNASLLLGLALAGLLIRRRR
jgi:hypothetical protein